MKLNLQESEHNYLFESFMDEERHSKLQKALFMSIFRNLIYHGNEADILTEIAEHCQTLEEAVYMAFSVPERRNKLTGIIIRNKDLARQVMVLGLTKKSQAIEAKEAFLREMEETYLSAWGDFKEKRNKI